MTAVNSGDLRSLLQNFLKSESDAARLPNLFTLYRRIHSLTSNSAVAGLNAISKMSSALEALVKELYEKPKNINPSTLRTLAHAIDFLALLFEHSSNLALEGAAPPNILVVDRELLARGKFVVTLGGEHTITRAPVAAHLERNPAMSVLQIDAHSDLRETYQGSAFSHASVMARVAEIVDPRRIVQVGICAQCIEESRFIRGKVGEHLLRPCHPERRTRPVVAGGGGGALTDDVYVTFDVDGLDPSIMPSTGTPEPNGLFWAETMQLLRLVGERKRIVGCDVVELAPVKGLPQADLTAAKLVYKLMNYAFLR